MGQQTFNWTFLDRKSWIEGAMLPTGKANDGSGVSAATMKAVLHKINDHLGDNCDSWPSRETIAGSTSKHIRTITRATQALERLGLMIIRKVPRKKGGGFKNYYRPVWTDIQLYEQERRKLWLAVLKMKHGDILTEHGDILTEHGDILTEHGDTMSPEQLTNNSKNNPKNNPPLDRSQQVSRRISGAQAVPNDWSVVVSVLKSFGMSATSGAVTAAIARELTPADVLDLTERYRRHKLAEPRANVGWLYRWITGDSLPPTEIVAERARPRVPMLSSDEQRSLSRELLRSRIVRSGRKAGLSESEIDSRLAKALIESNPKLTALAAGQPQPRRESIGSTKPVV